MWFNSVFDCLEHFRTEPIPVDGDSSEARLGDYVVKFPDAGGGGGGGFARGVSWPAGNVGMALGGILTTRVTAPTPRTTATTTTATTSARSSGSNSNRSSGVQNLPEPNDV